MRDESQIASVPAASRLPSPDYWLHRIDTGSQPTFVSAHVRFIRDLHVPEQPAWRVVLYAQRFSDRGYDRREETIEAAAIRIVQQPIQDCRILTPWRERRNGCGLLHGLTTVQEWRICNPRPFRLCDGPPLLVGATTTLTDIEKDLDLVTRQLPCLAARLKLPWDYTWCVVARPKIVPPVSLIADQRTHPKKAD
jgi:hypothetical protein